MTLRRFLAIGARRQGKTAALEAELDTRLAARRLARRRRELELEPIKATARQICVELGVPVPPALEVRA